MIMWKELYEQFISGRSFAELCTVSVDTIAKKEISISAAIKKCEKARAEYRSTNNTMLIQLIELACEIPVANAERAALELEKALVGLYAKYGISNYSHIAINRAHMLGTRSSPVRWMWTTVYAHLLVIAALGPEKLEDQALLRDATFVCARYAGHAFTDFAFMVLTMKTVTGMDPPAVDMIINYYLHVLVTEFGGSVPESHIYKDANKL